MWRDGGIVTNVEGTPAMAVMSPTHRDHTGHAGTGFCIVLAAAWIAVSLADRRLR